MKTSHLDIISSAAAVEQFSTDAGDVVLVSFARIQSLYETLLAAAPALGAVGSTGDKIDEVLDSARINANDTIYTEKAAPESEWNRIFRGSIETILASGDYSPEVKAWFADQGIRY